MLSGKYGNLPELALTRLRNALIVRGMHAEGGRPAPTDHAPTTEHAAFMRGAAKAIAEDGAPIPEGVTIGDFGALTLTTADGDTDLSVYVTQYGTLALCVETRSGCDHAGEPVQVIATFGKGEASRLIAAIDYVEAHGTVGHPVGVDRSGDNRTDDVDVSVLEVGDPNYWDYAATVTPLDDYSDDDTASDCRWIARTRDHALSPDGTWDEAPEGIDVDWDWTGWDLAHSWATRDEAVAAAQAHAGSIPGPDGTLARDVTKATR